VKSKSLSTNLIHLAVVAGGGVGTGIREGIGVSTRVGIGAGVGIESRG